MRIITELLNNPSGSMLLTDPYANFVIQSSLQRAKRAGTRDDKGNPIIRDYYNSPVTVRHRLMMLVFNKNQGLLVWSEYLIFNRVNAFARKGLVLGLMRLLLRFFLPD
ncbi:hypothetical protein RDI58_013292 [Solanum bulbocastanum]|uniref:Uncharacterized protein n=1 Tax=Solanum bulbocastanum TaxID=147425 RepID=A0AAN8YEI0_SOLBU